MLAASCFRNPNKLAAELRDRKKNLCLLAFSSVKILGDLFRKQTIIYITKKKIRKWQFVNSTKNLLIQSTLWKIQSNLEKQIILRMSRRLYCITALRNYIVLLLFSTQSHLFHNVLKFHAFYTWIGYCYQTYKYYK